MNRIIALSLGIAFLAGCASVRPPVTQKVPQSSPSPQVAPAMASQEKGLKRKVAIARFSNETKYGQGFFYDPNDDRLGKQAMDILSTRLTATDKFIMLERIDLSHLTKEKQMGNLSEMNIPADFLILGSVSEFGRKTTSEVNVFSRSKKQTAYAKVNIRLVDVATSQITYSEEGEGEATSEAETVLGVGKTADYDATLNDKVISAAISRLVNKIVENLLDKPWKSYLLSHEEGQFIIAGGTLQGIQEGDVFTVVKRGQKVLNPQAGTSIELPGKPVGTIRVVTLVKGDINSEVSVCRRESGEIPTTDFVNYFVQEN